MQEVHRDEREQLRRAALQEQHVVRVAEPDQLLGAGGSDIQQVPVLLRLESLLRSKQWIARCATFSDTAKC